jgi:hypothetical protein
VEQEHVEKMDLRQKSFVPRDKHSRWYFQGCQLSYSIGVASSDMFDKGSTRKVPSQRQKTPRGHVATAPNEKRQGVRARALLLLGVPESRKEAYGMYNLDADIQHAMEKKCICF